LQDAFVKSMSTVWGWPLGKYGSTIEDHGVCLEQVAVLNLAQCPVPDNSYRSGQLRLCWEKWSHRLLAALSPSLVVAQGRQVWDFLCVRELPAGMRLVEGVHHASRCSREKKQALIENVRQCVGMSRRTRHPNPSTDQ
jgi:hypothetical protein